MKLNITFNVVSIEDETQYTEDGSGICTVDERVIATFNTEEEANVWIVNMSTSAINIESCLHEYYRLEQENQISKIPMDLSTISEINKKIETLTNRHKEIYDNWMPTFPCEMRITKKFCIEY
jgi:D-hexose-6-phosphate mutarotase